MPIIIGTNRTNSKSNKVIKVGKISGPHSRTKEVIKHTDKGIVPNWYTWNPSKNKCMEIVGMWALRFTEWLRLSSAGI